MASLRGAAYRAAADSQAHGSRALGAESRSAQLQAQVSTWARRKLPRSSCNLAVFLLRVN